MLMIRLSRMGARKQPYYRIVVIEKARARNGRPVEVVCAHPCATVESLTLRYILVPEESGEVKTNIYYAGA